MSSTTLVAPQFGTGTTTASDVQSLLGALEDADCRCILSAVAHDALTAGELSEVCDLPRSTAYRKVDLLTESGLLEERTRIRPSGHHTSEYRRTCDALAVAFGDDGLTVELHCGDEGAASPGRRRS
jgi:DNA-binding transcriptional ArsR family regulator